jgi:uncharacterized RDD family membrane protein YckC
MEHSSQITYLLIVKGKPSGPYTIDGLKQLKIQPGDFVKSAAMDDYKEANEVTELCTALGFSRQAHIPQYFGSFDQRLLAAVIDWFLVSGGFTFLAVTSLVFVSDKATQFIIAFSLLVIIPLANLIYHIIMESSPKQATYGKQLLKIKVVDMQGERLSPAHAAGRNLAKILSVLTFFIGYLLSFFNRQQQCLHDMVAGTLVMKDRLF